VVGHIEESLPFPFFPLLLSYSEGIDRNGQRKKLVLTKGQSSPVGDLNFPPPATNESRR